MKIFVTGATGQLGTTVVREFGRGHDVVPRALEDLDITRHADVLRHVRDAHPDVIVNCAAYNDVDGAEDEPRTSLEVNAFAVRSLARAAAEVGAALVHYSTDFVFDGEGVRPYTEDDAPAPRGAYATSKLLGDWFARDAERHYVLRVESLFGGFALGAPRMSSVDRIADALLERREAVVFVDRTVSPSFVIDVARATRQVVEQRLASGLYHCVNSGLCTWYELGEEVARVVGVPALLKPTRVADVPMRAARPKYCALSNAKLAAAGVAMPPWQDAIGRYLRMRAGSSGGPLGPASSPGP
jgi:dTDP-4-dehydrorhamnose reductase